MAPQKKQKRKSLPGISRIDQLDKHNHGWFVRVTRHGKTYSMFFADKRYGGKTSALKEAQSGYQQMVKKFPPMSRRDFSQIERRKSKSGIVGVTRLTKAVRGRNYHFWQATWSPKPGVIQKKAFSIGKYGEAKARKLAVLTRKQGLSVMGS
jgi:hypothetical protein